MTLAERYNLEAGRLLPHMAADLQVDPAITRATEIDEIVFRRGEFVIHAADLFGLEGLDILEPIDHPAAELDEFRAFARPPPALQRAVRDVPASRQLDLGKVPGRHVNLLGISANTCGFNMAEGWEALGRRKGCVRGGIEFVRKILYVSDKERPTRTAQMTGISDRIMKRLRSKGRGKWVCTPKDFLDLGSRAAIDQALSRLAKSGDLRRVGRGLYDLPRTSGVLKRPAPVDMDKAVAALARRDSVRIMPDGIAAANQLGLTNAVPAKTSYVTDGATRDVKIGNRTVRLRHAGPSVMAWAGKTSAPVAQALRWLGPQAALDTRVATTLKRKLPDAVKKDLVRNSGGLPSWAAPIAHSLVDPQIATP